MELTIAMCKAAFKELGARSIADVYPDGNTCGLDYVLKCNGVAEPTAYLAGYYAPTFHAMPEWGVRFMDALDSKFSGSEWGRATGTEMLALLDAVLRAPQ